MLGYRNCTYRHRRNFLYMVACRKSFVISRNNRNSYSSDFYYLYSDRNERNVQQYSYKDSNCECIANSYGKLRSNDLQRNKYNFNRRRSNYLFVVSVYRVIFNSWFSNICKPNRNNNLYSNRFERNLQQYGNSYGVS